MYGSAGTFQARLTVTDDSGGSASATRDIVVTAAPAPPPPPAPAPPPPVAPKLVSSQGSVAVAKKRVRRNGRLRLVSVKVSVSFTVTDQATGQGVVGKLTCRGKLNGVLKRTSSQEVLPSGKATCVWSLPPDALGRLFAGSIFVRYMGVKANRPFSVTL